MPWPVILSALTFTVISAALVFLRHWDPWAALLGVGLATAGIILLLLAVMLTLAGRTHRAELWGVFTSTVSRDLDQVLRWFRLRR